MQRRDSLALERRLISAGFEERVTLDDFDWTTAIQLDRRHLNELFSLHFLARKEHVLLIGPAGVGKTFLAQALGAAATRAGHAVLFRRADVLLGELGQAKGTQKMVSLSSEGWAIEFGIHGGVNWLLARPAGTLQRTPLRWSEGSVQRFPRKEFTAGDAPES